MRTGSAPIHTYIYIYLNIYIHIYTYIHTYVYTHNVYMYGSTRTSPAPCSTRMRALLSIFTDAHLVRLCSPGWFRKPLTTHSNITAKPHRKDRMWTQSCHKTGGPCKVKVIAVIRRMTAMTKFWKPLEFWSKLMAACTAPWCYSWPLAPLKDAIFFLFVILGRQLELVC